MNKEKAKKLALTILTLDYECRNNQNISENSKKMEEIMEALSVSDLFQLAATIEEIDCIK